MPRIVLLLAASLMLPITTFAAAPLKPLKIRVDNLPREGLVYVPTATPAGGLPLVFVFHGHGGTAAKAAEGFAIHEYWPEAACVYLQGVPTPSGADPQGKRPGWQRDAGEYGDRDLHLFDAALARMKQQHKIDEHRIFATGFSNGGFFTYLLWAERGDTFAAISVCAAVPGKKGDELKPKPYLHIAGQNDDMVPFDSQQKAMEFVHKLNGCSDVGELWSNPGMKITTTMYASSSGTPFVSAVHAGGHEVPTPGGGRLMARFFNEQRKP